MKKKLFIGITSCLIIFTAFLSISIAQNSEKRQFSPHDINLDEIPSIGERLPGVDPSLYEPEIPEYLVSKINNENKSSQKTEENQAISLLGFEGKYYLDTVNGETVNVVEESLNIEASKEGLWQVKGLIRNERLTPISNAIVNLTLFGLDKEIVEQLQVNVPLEFIRSGEPAPFEIISSSKFDQVGSYYFTVKFNEVNSTRDFNRGLVLSTFWKLQYGQTHYKQVPRDDDPDYPYVLSVGFQNMESYIKDSKLHVAWLNDKSQVIHIEEAKLDDLFLSGFDKYASGSYKNIVIHDSEIAKRINDSEYILWGIGK